MNVTDLINTDVDPVQEFLGFVLQRKRTVMFLFIIGAFIGGTPSFFQKGYDVELQNMNVGGIPIESTIETVKNLKFREILDVYAQKYAINDFLSDGVQYSISAEGEFIHMSSIAWSEQKARSFLEKAVQIYFLRQDEKATAQKEKNELFQAKIRQFKSRSESIDKYLESDKFLNNPNAFSSLVQSRSAYEASLLGLQSEALKSDTRAAVVVRGIRFVPFSVVSVAGKSFIGGIFGLLGSFFLLFLQIIFIGQRKSMRSPSMSVNRDAS